MVKNIELFRKEFFLENPTHIPLNNAGLTLIPKVTQKKINDLVQLGATEGVYSAPIIFEDWVKSKEVLAKFIGAKVHEVAWTNNCSSALSFIANGYKSSENEEILIFENDYPANFYPWVARAKRCGSQLKIVKAERDLTRPLDKVLSQITPNTKIVALSHIQSDCGYLMDISKVAEAAHKVGAILVVDVIQSAGIYPLNFEMSGADVFCGGTQKWLCGTMGGGFLVVKESLLSSISPSLHGALNYGSFDEEPKVETTCFVDSRKFEQGTPSFYSILGATESMKLLMEYSVDNLWKKAMSLREILKNEFLECGFTVYGGNSTGPHISVTHNKVTLKGISESLNKEKISHALRPTPHGEGKVLRLSPCAYNTENEINFTLEVIKKALG